MKYIAVLDFHHLDNAIFLKAFAKALSAHKERKGIIIHGDSAYTDRLIQTGMMREDARIRATKDLNRRLVALLADHGVSTIGVNAYQKDMVALSEKGVLLNQNVLESLPQTPSLLISNLISGVDAKPQALALPDFSKVFRNTLSDYETLVFSMEDKDEIITSSSRPNQISGNDLDEAFKNQYVPEEFHNADSDYIISSPANFSIWPDLSNATKVQLGA